MVKKIMDVVIFAGTTLLGMYLTYPGVKRLIEGPEVSQVAGVPGFDVVSTFDTPTYAVMQIMMGCGVMLLGHFLRDSLGTRQPWFKRKSHGKK